MTPTFKYDPDSHCLREVARLREPALSEFKTNAYWMAMDVYNLHLASLRVIPCVENSVWPQVELIEGVHFEVRMRMWENRTRYAWPIQSTQPRLYTQAEAEEIWDGGWNAAIYYSIHDEENITKQQYFKTRFNVELTPQTP